MNQIEQAIRSLHNDIIVRTGFKYKEYLSNPKSTCRKIRNLKIALSFLYLRDPTIPKNELLSLITEMEQFSC